MERTKVYQVGELTREIKTLIETAIGSVWIEGEISNLRRPPSGHLYFTLKDPSAQISAVLFKGNQRGLTFIPRDGLQVRVQGDVTVYEHGGNYQVIVRQMRQGGAGALQARFEELKARLQAEGLFDSARKKALPLLPRRVGVVTSPTGAVIRDILTVLGRRFPNLHLILVPVRVQGAGAAEEIAAAIDLLNARDAVDVMIVGRGGGSMEDLWCFNEEIVARAVARSSIPVISAVGHETDFTICDFVADVRAPTPSAAAEIVVERKDALSAGVERLEERLLRAAQEKLLRARHRLLRSSGSYVFREPGNVARTYRMKLEKAQMRMTHECRAAVRERRQRVDDAGSRLGHRVSMRRERAGQDLRRFKSQLDALNPMAVLERGYAVVSDARGRIVRIAADLRAGELVRTRVAQGTFDSVVSRTDGASVGGKQS
jgi:exodeoxyribonuclease VII large subunit